MYLLRRDILDNGTAAREGKVAVAGGMATSYGPADE